MNIDINKIKLNLKDVKNPRTRRISNEFIQLDELCSKSKAISYEIVDLLNRRDDLTVKEMIESGNHPPIKYILTYELKSIVGIDSSKMPIYGNYHQTEIVLPNDYPISPAKCTMLTDIWHPNIKSRGFVKGKICINHNAIGMFHGLDNLAIRIAEYLQWKNYHADENIPPFPEDVEVANWVKEFAEPNNIVDKTKEIFIDNTELYSNSAKIVDGRNEMKLQGKSFLISKAEAKSYKLKIAEGFLKDVIDEFKDLPLLNHQFNELAIISSRLKEVERNLNMNIISDDNYNLTVNKIRKSALDFVDDLSNSQISKTPIAVNKDSPKQVVLKKRVVKETIEITIRLVTRGEEVQVEVPINMKTDIRHKVVLNKPTLSCQVL